MRSSPSSPGATAEAEAPFWLAESRRCCRGVRLAAFPGKAETILRKRGRTQRRLRRGARRPEGRGRLGIRRRSVSLSLSFPFVRSRFPMTSRLRAVVPDNTKRRPKPASLSGLLCLLARWLAQHSSPDVRSNNMKWETHAHCLSHRALLLASHGPRIIGEGGRVSRPFVQPRT